MIVKISGTTFRKNKFSPVIGDEVILNHDRDNKFDDKAVEVIWNTDFLGYLPKGSDAQALFFKGGLTATISDFAHSRGEEDGIKEWNNEGEGYLESVTLEACVEGGTRPVKEEVAVSHYSKDGKPYRRISEVLTELTPKIGTQDQRDRFEVWQKNTDEEKTGSIGYRDGCAKVGTQVHHCLEIEAKTGKSMLQTILDKHRMEIVGIEQTVYDDELMIAGTYDLRLKDIDTGECVTVDYKTSNTPNDKHRLQLGYYGHQNGDKEAWVVLVGKDNKQGYQITKVDVEKYYGMLKAYLHNAGGATYEGLNYEDTLCN